MRCLTANEVPIRFSGMNSAAIDTAIKAALGQHGGLKEPELAAILGLSEETVWKASKRLLKGFRVRRCADNGELRLIDLDSES